VSLSTWTYWPLQKHPKAEKEAKRDDRSFFPILLQGFAYACVWRIHSACWTALFGLRSWPFLGALAVLIAVISVWLVIISVRTLGKQWAVAARLVEGHKLITSGPYSFIRNPIYTGMFGMLVATGMVASQWFGLLIGVVLFLAATAWGIRVEEQLLHGRFGSEFEEYRGKVSALIPLVW